MPIYFVFLFCPMSLKLYARDIKYFDFRYDILIYIVFLLELINEYVCFV